ncbi:multidrug transporter [Vibrio parahaemolyticus EN9701121]|nr:multidrug transporter [Vibrio parahaemolyticus EN9701121]
MAWGILFIAGLCEIAWAVGLKYSQGFTKFGASAFTIVFMLLSFWLLGIALRTLPLGIAYGVWVGIGAIGTAIVSIYLFNEPATLIKALSLLMIVAGIAGLKISNNTVDSGFFAFKYLARLVWKR